MSVAFSKPRDPDRIPEHHLWRMTKNFRCAEARLGMVPGGPELRIYVTRLSDDIFDLLWSHVFKDGRELAAQSEKTRGDFEARGWLEDPLDVGRAVFGDIEPEPS